MVNDRPFAAPALAAPKTFTIPLVVTFEDERGREYHEHVADQLGGTLAEGRLLVESDNPPGRCRLSPSTLGAGGVRSTYVDVVARPRPGAFDGEAMVGAGLTIRHTDGDTISFLSFLLSDDGYEILAFENGAVGQRVGSSLPDGFKWPARISARETEGGAEFFLNGQSVGRITDSRITGSSFGLIHCGPGQHEYDNWGQNTRGDVGFEAVGVSEAPPAHEDELTVSETPSRTAPPPLAVWWVEDDGKPLGPMTIQEVRARLDDGRSSSETLVWRKGMADWAPAGEAVP